MKRILFILIFFVCYFGFSQGGPKVDVIKFRDKVTSTARDAFDVPSGEIWMIYNTTTQQFEYAEDDDVWNPVSSASGDEWSDAVDSNIIPDGSGTRDLGSIANAFRLLVTEDVYFTDGSASLDWRIFPDSGDLVFYEHDGSVWQERYRMQSGGAPTGSNDVADKGYVDAAISGTGSVPDDTGSSDGDILTTDGAGTYTWETPTWMNDLVDDSTPQLGGTLDFNSQSITGDIIPSLNGEGNPSGSSLGSASYYFFEIYADYYRGNYVLFESNTAPGALEGLLYYKGSENRLELYDGTSFKNVLLEGDGGSGDVTAASSFGTDNVLIRSDGTSKGVQSSGIEIDDSDNMDMNGGDINNVDDIVMISASPVLNARDTDNANNRGFDWLIVGNDWRFRSIDDVTTYGEYLLDGDGDPSDPTSIMTLGKTQDITVASTISGRTGSEVQAIQIETPSEITSNGAVGTNEIVFCDGCPPMAVGTSSTITVDAYRGYDDRSTDAATFTFSNLAEGGTVLIEINRASDATYSGITIAHTDGAFAANTRQLVILFVLPSGDVWRTYKDLE